MNRKAEIAKERKGAAREKRRRGLLQWAKLRAERLETANAITDGYGNYWSRICAECGGEMQVVRPGEAQCGKCG